jgi:hypothetical protein
VCQEKNPNGRILGLCWPAFSAINTHSVNRQEWDAGRVQRALACLEETARSTQNLMPAMPEAVKAYATIGEICGTLTKVFGWYTDPSVAVVSGKQGSGLPGVQAAQEALPMRILVAKPSGSFGMLIANKKSRHSTPLSGRSSQWRRLWLANPTSRFARSRPRNGSAGAPSVGATMSPRHTWRGPRPCWPWPRAARARKPRAVRAGGVERPFGSWCAGASALG